MKLDLNDVCVLTNRTYITHFFFLLCFAFSKKNQQTLRNQPTKLSNKGKGEK